MSIARPPTRRSSGFVLVIVLLALALMMILLLALFQGTLKQTHGAAGDAYLGREKMLADSAVALVIGQIQQASTQPGQAWISQPGLLRTYAANAPRAPTACYKLYSTPNLTGMIDTSGTLAFMGSDVPANWSSEPSQYTDLNAPVQTAGFFGQTIYPILDPGAVTAVQGVSIDTGSSVQMPVAWLYQLQDGTLGPASNGTAANPIVARIAFWTDDETSKIDVNTAGCGSPWNTPHVNSPDDVTWSKMQPAAGEYSAYPGHPATTSLAVVFGSGSNALKPQQLLGLTPRYAWGGSEFGSQPTTSGESVLPKMDRLYASVDELCFSSSLASGQRGANPITPSQLNVARFVLTAHSEAPETTLLGEPRVAIWPVADSTSSTAPTITATDRAIMTAATVGMGTSNVRNYYFQRSNPLNPLDDFNPTPPLSAATSSNILLFNDLLARGQVIQPGYTSAFNSEAVTAKYPDANWQQLMLEITDFIRGLNAVDPSPAPFVPFAHTGSTGVGYGFVIPLTTTYTSGSNKLTLRGLGRCPTLSSLTVVFYVSGFGFKNNTYIDYTETPDNAAGASWNANFAPGSPQWKNVVNERVRAFVVPCTFQPGCAYPEVSDACTIQISGLNNITMSSGGKSGNFGFGSPAVSFPLGTPLINLPADRAWGGNEGPIAWRAAADVADGGILNYPFAGANAFAVPMTTTTQSQLDPKTGGGGWPPTGSITVSTASLTVTINDLNNNVLQTLSVTMPGFTIPAHDLTIIGEGDHADAVPPATSDTNWANDATCNVAPSWYMSLLHRLQTSPSSRPVMIQAGDVSRSMEAATDLRVIAALSTVPSSMFQQHPDYIFDDYNTQGGSHAHNFRFADGTSACFAVGEVPSNSASTISNLVNIASYPAVTATIPVHDWRTGALLTAQATTGITPYTYFTSPPCSVPTGMNGVTMPSGAYGDWDTGPGIEPDGAQINLPDSGTTLAPAVAYQSLGTGQVGVATQRTPNALVPSPVIFGSLPAGINPNDSASTASTFSSQPWRSLLFCPYPASNTSGLPYTNHPGAASTTGPPDHLLLDNFWMPVIEPYAIGTCMATAGKVNLNDQIAPFTYLHRSTALRALLADLRIPAIPISAANAYKSSGLPTSIWNAVDEDSTIAQIENKFAGGSVDAYLSESEICTVPLVPSEPSPSPFSTNVAATQTALSSFWNVTLNSAGGLTGDNLRELPYAQLYGRLTTRSNSYTVHVRVQVLKKLTHDPNQNVWNEGTDVVLGDWRGSYEIERYLDSAAAAPTTRAPAAGSRLGPYKFRIVSARAFAP